MPEVDLEFMAAVEFGGGVGTRVFLRCTSIRLPQDEKQAREEKKKGKL